MTARNPGRNPGTTPGRPRSTPARHAVIRPESRSGIPAGRHRAPPGPASRTGVLTAAVLLLAAAAGRALRIAAPDRWSGDPPRAAAARDRVLDAAAWAHPALVGGYFGGLAAGLAGAISYSAHRPAGIWVMLAGGLLWAVTGGTLWALYATPATWQQHHHARTGVTPGGTATADTGGSQ